jgi:Aspartyl protease
MKQQLLTLIIFFTGIVTQAQEIVIDTIPFSLQSSLLVFKGKVNGIETNFALDTGAGTSVITTHQSERSGVKPSGKVKINDSNENKSKIRKAKIDELQIGSQTIKNSSCVVFDMPFLACNDFFLLGANVINQLNWKIDFENNVLYISKKAFEPSTEMIEMKVKFIKFRHFTDFKIQDINITNCLIDTGFNDFFEASVKDPNFIQLKDRHEGRIIPGKDYYSFSFDGLQFGNITFDDVKIELKENTEKKIGIKLFSTLAKVLIMNNHDSKYHLLLSNKPVSLVMSFDADYHLINGKLKIVGKMTNPESTASDLEFEEEIKSVDGKTATDFKDECEFLLWKFEIRHKNEIEIEKVNGQKIIIKKQLLKTN